MRCTTPWAPRLPAENVACSKEKHRIILDFGRSGGSQSVWHSKPKLSQSEWPRVLYILDVYLPEKKFVCAILEHYRDRNHLRTRGTCSCIVTVIEVFFFPASMQAVGDLMQTLAGAVLLDANFDIEVVWKVT